MSQCVFVTECTLEKRYGSIFKNVLVHWQIQIQAKKPGGSVSPNRQVHRNFQTDKQKRGDMGGLNLLVVHVEISPGLSNVHRIAYMHPAINDGTDIIAMVSN